MLKIAIDAMGGDNAPFAIVEGVKLAREKWQDIEFLLYGNEEAIKPLLDGNSDRITIIHTKEKIESDDEPVKAIRSKKEASMVLAAQAVKNKEADALFSAGNTGALLAAGLFIIGRIKGIERPGLMPTLPVISKQSPSNKVVFMDVGANADNKPKHLNQFATLGSYYAKEVLQIEKPRVALLNNGTEYSKGSELSKSAYELLVNNPAIHFIGNVESRDLLNGVSDVVVTDGFTGNAVLKSIEGTALTMSALIKETIVNGNIMTKVGGLMIQNALKSVKDVMDYSKYGGAVLFGLKSPVVKTHGSADEQAVYYTIKQIRTMLHSRVIDNLIEYFESEENQGEE